MKRFPALNRSLCATFVLGVAVGLAMMWISAALVPQARAQAKSQWVITGQLAVPGKGKSTYRMEDPELEVVCYTEYLDLSGAIACGKK